MSENKKKSTFNLDKERPTTPDGHQLKLNKQVDIEFNENYKFITNNIFARIANRLLWIFATVILGATSYALYGIKIRGRKNIRKAIKRNKGIVTIANHCMIMDSPFCAFAMNPYQIWLPTVEETLKIPKIRFIVKALHAIPIPSNARGLAKFGKTCEKLLYKGKIVHFFPEGALWPWYTKLRPFKAGAFRFATTCDAAILPIAITFRPRTWFWRLFGRKPLVSLNVLEPLTSNKIYKQKAATKDLLQRSYDAMSQFITPTTESDFTE